MTLLSATLLVVGLLLMGAGAGVLIDRALATPRRSSSHPSLRDDLDGDGFATWETGGRP